MIPTVATPTPASRSAGASERVTIYDVAQRAGVSISTVSLSLNHPQRVNAATRARVLAAADELGFVPRSEAVSRARKAAGRIGVVAPFTSYASYLRRLSGVMEELADDALEIAVYSERSAASTASPLLSALPIGDRIDGLIVMGLELEEQTAERLVRRGVPTVVVDVDSRRFSSVRTHDEEGGELVADYLLERGHRHFAYLMEAPSGALAERLRDASPDYPYQGVRRLHGFHGRLAAAGIAQADVPLQFSPHTIADARARAASLLDEHPHVTAIACHDDTLAAGAQLAARDRGLDVPGQLAVMGFDDGAVAEAAQLTTVRQPLEESGRVAARTLKAHMSGVTEARQQIVLGLEVIARASA
jgi:LacI family transcriptional regulator